MFIYKKILNQLRIDESEERKVLFQYLLANRSISSVVYKILSLSPRLVRAISALIFGAINSSTKISHFEGEVLAIWSRDVELNAMIELQNSLDFKLNLIDWKKKSIRIFLLNILRYGLKVFPLLYKLTKKHHTYSIMRASETYFGSLRLKRAFILSRPKFLLTSTDSNPHGTAMFTISKALSIKIMFLSHGAISIDPTKISSNVAIFYGEKNLNCYRQINSHFENVLYYPHKDIYQKINLKSTNSVGIFLSKNPDLEELERFISSIISKNKEAQIILRPHPSSLIPFNLISKFSNIVLSTFDEISTDIEKCSIIVAGKSTVHLECLVRGTPSIYFPKLDTKTSLKLSFLESQNILTTNTPINYIWDDKEIKNWYSENLKKDWLNQYMNLEYSKQSYKQALKVIFT